MRMTAACLFSIALLILVGAGRVDAQPGRLAAFWASPCTLDVVLVAFKDTTARHRGTTPSRNDSDFYNYYEHDLPHGYTIPNGVLTPGTSSYTMDDFERLFSGGYHYSVNEEEEPLVLIPEYTGTPTVADSETLPEVFGSLRHYFHEVSGGDFELHLRILNLERGNYPVWVQLPQTKGHYAERAMGNEFWLHAERAMRDSVRAWGLDTAVYDPPDDTYGPARRLQRNPVAGSRQRPGRVQHPLQHRGVVEALVDAQAGLAQPGQALPQDLVVPFHPRHLRRGEEEPGLNKSHFHQNTTRRTPVSTDFPLGGLYVS